MALLDRLWWYGRGRDRRGCFVESLVSRGALVDAGICQFDSFLIVSPAQQVVKDRHGFIAVAEQEPGQPMQRPALGQEIVVCDLLVGKGLVFLSGTSLKLRDGVFVVAAHVQNLAEPFVRSGITVVKVDGVVAVIF